MHVDRVDISWLESLTLEGRAAYFDGAGALKDMVQNHLMEAVALVLMQQPARADADSFRSVRVEALRTVATPSAETMAHRHDPRSVHRRHDRLPAGSLLRRRTRRRPQPQDRDVRVPDPRREQRTVDGVPFTLRSGKAFQTDSAEIAIHFRPLPRYLTDQWPGVEPNVLRIGLTEPYVRLATTLNGPGQTAEHRQQRRARPRRGHGHSHLIQEMLEGDPMLFIRGDEAQRPGASSTP